MKTKALRCCVLLATALTFCPFAPGAPPANPTAAENPSKIYDTLVGVIKEVKESQMTVEPDEGKGATEITLSGAVLITKDDQPAELKDLVPKVRVEVKMKVGSLVALSIKILPAEPKTSGQPLPL